MSNIDIELDEEACNVVMQRFGLADKSEAVNFALRVLAAGQMSLAEARSLEGMGWSGDLDVMRANRI